MPQPCQAYLQGPCGAGSEANSLRRTHVRARLLQVLLQAAETLFSQEAYLQGPRGADSEANCLRRTHVRARLLQALLQASETLFSQALRSLWLVCLRFGDDRFAFLIRVQ